MKKRKHNVVNGVSVANNIRIGRAKGEQEETCKRISTPKPVRWGKNVCLYESLDELVDFSIYVMFMASSSAFIENAQSIESVA